jgi:hypothetical protein
VLKLCYGSHLAFTRAYDMTLNVYALRACLSAVYTSIYMYRP